MTQGTQDLEYISHQLDTRFRGPFGFRFGWDGILGLIPGVGDLVTSSFAFYIIVRAAILGAPPMVLARMGLNVLIDNVFDVVPVLGWIFDFAWKANQKNVRLLQDFTRNQKKIHWQSRLWVFAVLFLIFALLLAFIAGGFYLLAAIINYIQSLSTTTPVAW